MFKNHLKFCCSFFNSNMYDISSDSDGDYYDKFPQKLQKLKKKHALNDRLEAAKKLLEDKAVDSNSVSLINKKDSDVIPVFDLTVNQYSTDVIPIETVTPSGGVSTRSRRSKRRNSDVPYSPVASTQNGGKRGRTRGRGKSSQTSIPSTSQPRGRGRRKRGAQNVTNCDPAPVDAITPPVTRSVRSRRRGNQRISRNSSIITYSVGNTDEYPDKSDNQALFTNKNTISGEQTEVIDLDESLDNEELSVKVYWQHSEVFKFNIRRLQKLTQIFDFFVDKHGVSKDSLLFTYNSKTTNKILRPDDTPDTIDYNIARFIEGGIVNEKFSLNTTITPQKKGFIIKFQCQNMKKPFELTVDKDKRLQLAMVKCSEHFETPITNLVFEFDGEIINGNKTPKDLDMESGDCIDVKLINVNK